MIEKAIITDPTIVLDNNVTRVDGPNEKELVLKNFQEIPDWFIQRLKDTKEQAPKGAELRKVASIPTGVVEHWKKQGFDINKESAQAIVLRLSTEDMGDFITGVP
jgi:hypothetical protein